MSRLTVKSWQKFQHFKNRKPPWIKLYRDILDDPEWHELDGQSAKVLVMLWLLASEDVSQSGTLPDVRKIAFRLRMTEHQISLAISKLSHWVYQDDIKMISTRYQDDTPEREREGERETEIERETELLSGKNPDGAIPYSKIISLLNQKANSDFKTSTQTTRNLIKARFNEGFTFSDFESVIEAKCEEWLGNDKMFKFIRPQTLFGPKFESYLQNSKSESTAKSRWV